MKLAPKQTESTHQFEGNGTCPWCKEENIPHHQIEHHREACPYRRPVTSIKTIGVIFKAKK